MSHSPAPQATAYACLRVALRADAAGARARRGAGLAALILTLLLRLLARTEAAWDILPEDTDDSADFEYPAHAIRMPTMGRAPHADCIEAGLVPDWILPGVRNRGMRPAAAPARPRRRARPARAPPPSIPPQAEITPWLGAPPHAHFRYENIIVRTGCAWTKPGYLAPQAGTAHSSSKPRGTQRP